MMNEKTTITLLVIGGLIILSPVICSVVEKILERNATRVESKFYDKDGNIQRTETVFYESLK